MISTSRPRTQKTSQLCTAVGSSSERNHENCWNTRSCRIPMRLLQRCQASTCRRTSAWSRSRDGRQIPSRSRMDVGLIRVVVLQTTGAVLRPRSLWKAHQDVSMHVGTRLTEEVSRCDYYP